MKVRLVTAVWGADFVDLFLRVALRSLMTKGNLPDLARAYRTAYTIYTTAEDAALLERAPIFRQLRAVVELKVSVFALGEVSRDPTTAHHELWERGLGLAKRNREVLFLLIPDILYAAGTLTRWARRLEEGWGAVYTPGPFVSLETALSEIESRFPAGHGAISIGPEEIPDLLFRHLHPLEASMLRDAPRRARHPEHDIRAVPGRGLVIRAFASQPFCLNPASFEHIRYINPEDHLDEIWIEPCTAVSLEPLLKSASWYYRGYPLNRMHLTHLGAWWSIFGTASAKKESESTYDFTVRDDAIWKTGRARAAAGGRMMRAQLHAASVIYKIWKALVARGYHRTGEILAAAHYAAALRRRLVVPGRAVILAPSDSAYSAAAESELAAFLESDRENGVVRLIKEHVLHSDKGLEQIPRGLYAAGEAFVVDSFTIYPVDRVILPGGRLAGGAAHSATITKAQVATTITRPVSNVGTGGSAAGRPKLHEFKTQARNALRRALLRLESFPGAKRPTALASRVVEIAVREGWRGVAWRVLSRVRLILRRFDPLHRYWVAATLPVRTIGRGLRYTNRHGIEAAWQGQKRSLRSWASRLGDQLPWRSSPQRNDRELLRQLRQVRILQALRDILGHYQSAISLADQPSEPLRWVSGRLVELLRECGTVEELLEKRIRRLAFRHPRWSEAWLELGYVQWDRGNAGEAFRSFARAAEGSWLEGSGGPGRDPRLEARAARARMLAAQNRHPEAEEEFAAGLACRADDRMLNLEYGYYLWSRGEWRRAVRYFSSGMEYDPVLWPLGAMPRDANALDFGLLAGRQKALAS